MKWQIHNIQVLLANELDQYKDKGEERVNEYIEVLQEVYQDTPQPIVINK